MQIRFEYEGQRKANTRSMYYPTHLRKRKWKRHDRRHRERGTTSTELQLKTCLSLWVVHRVWPPTDLGLWFTRSNFPNHSPDAEPWIDLDSLSCHRLYIFHSVYDFCFSSYSSLLYFDCPIRD